MYRDDILGLAAAAHAADLANRAIPADDWSPARIAPGPAARAMRARLNQCPTCAEGVLTIDYPARCRECVKGGL
jgi:hypothetical protein